MRELGNTAMSLPFVAIIPGKAPDRPILIKAQVSKDEFLKLLEEATRPIERPVNP